MEVIMEFVVVLIFLIVIGIFIKIVFGVDIKKVKEISKNEYLDKITSKYPDNINICKEILKKINNDSVNIVEDKNSNTTLYLVNSNKIFIANLRESYTRIQTIAHECLHSIQDKKMLWTNFIFSNVYLLYFIIINILAICNVLQNKMMFLTILSLGGLVYYVIRAYLENDAMIKARYLAKEYMEDKNISSKEEIENIIKKYDELNKVGIKCVNFQLFFSIIFKCMIFCLICILSLAF